MNTVLSLDGTKFRLNGALTYSEIPDCPTENHGLLMNSRMIQGVFDEHSDPSRFARFGFEKWDPEAQTQRLIDSLPEWKRFGLRAITVGFQGGGPCFTIDNHTIENNPFGPNGNSIDPSYAKRMDRVIRACDALGLVTIVSYFYSAQMRFFENEQAIVNAVRTASRWLKNQSYTNVIIEIANEHNLGEFEKYAPICHSPYGMTKLIHTAQEESSGIPVGCSGYGNTVTEQIAHASDVVLIHGNDCTRQELYELILKAKSFAPDKPIVVNEDSQAISNLDVCVREGVSWGYYNNATKQEPPSRFEILPGEDTFFAYRMAKALGIETPELPSEEQYKLQGLEEHTSYEGECWPRLASLYPESIDSVEFFRNGEFYYRSYDDPFTTHFVCNWKQLASPYIRGETWKALVHLRNGTQVEREFTIPKG